MKVVKRLLTFFRHGYAGFCSGVAGVYLAGGDGDAAGTGVGVVDEDIIYA